MNIQEDSIHDYTNSRACGACDITLLDQIWPDLNNWLENENRIQVMDAIWLRPDYFLSYEIIE